MIEDVIEPFVAAINILATFVHNEPTSLTTIQEARLPDTIFNAIESGIESSSEVRLQLRPSFCRLSFHTGY